MAKSKSLEEKTQKRLEKTFGGKKPSKGMSEQAKSSAVKQAKKGKDMGKPGKNFKKIEASAAKKYGSKEAGKKVAGSIFWKIQKKGKK